MRIRRYPGKAIDASLSLDKSNAMETIYKNNWLNAHETFKSSSSTNSVTAPGYETDGSSSRGGDDVVGVSSLGKYQMTLDQIRQLQLQHKDPTVAQAMKDLSGYKPSTLSRKNRRNYPGWDDLLIVDSTTAFPTTVAEQLDQTADETTAYNYAQPLKSAVGRKSAADRQQIPVHTKTSETFNNVQIPMLESVPSEKNSKLKRSQTLKESSAASFCSTLDIKDIFRRRQKNNCIETSTLKKPKKPSSSSSGSSSGNSSGQSSNKSSADMSNNCDRNSLDLNRMQNAYNASASPPPPSSSSVQRAKSVRLISAAGWTTTPAQSDELIMVAPQRRREKPPSPPPRRANASLRPRQLPPPPPPPAALSLVGYNNNKNKFNTISASGINKVHKRMAVIPIEDVSLPPIKPILKHVQIVDRSRQTAGETTSAAASNVLPPLAIMARRKPASSSSADSDEMFSIPRPRLIVPVHTYARRRRTGNLLNAKNDDDDGGGGGCDEVEELNDKGMSFIFV